LLNLGEGEKKEVQYANVLCSLSIHSFIHSSTKDYGSKTKWKYYTCPRNITMLFTLTFHIFVYILHAFTSYKCVIIIFYNMIYITTILCESKSTIYMHNICCNLTFSWDKWTNNFKSLRAIV
jgi:hypothetical protein